MPHFIRNREELEHLLITMHFDGWKIRALSRHFEIGRNTVRRVLRKHENQRNKGEVALTVKKKIPKESKLDTYVPLIKKLLEKFPNITGQRLYEELKDSGYEGKITILRDRLRTLRPKAKKEPEVRFETAPGIQGQMDWSPYKINFIRTGKSEVLCFSYILGFSRRHYIDFTLRRDFYTLIRRHQDAFRHFGGVPKQCLYDGEKTVLLRWEGGRPVFNPAFIVFITHYNCRPIACKPGRAKTKGKIEQPFKYIEGNLLNGRDFQDFDDLKSKARWWLPNKSDVHIHDTTHFPPIELFLTEEQKALTPLPLHPYDSAEVKLLVCRLDGFIEFETNRYSLPYEYVGDIISMKALESEIFIYSPDLSLVARHERFPAGAFKESENPEHRVSGKVRYGLEPVKEVFIALGDAAELFMKGMKDKFQNNCGFQARYILRLKERYTCEDINKALYHAVKYGAFEGKTIERILKAKARTRTLESIRNEKAINKLEMALPKIKQRSLEAYGTLFNINKEENYDCNSQSIRSAYCKDKKAPENFETE